MSLSSDIINIISCEITLTKQNLIVVVQKILAIVTLTYVGFRPKEPEQSAPIYFILYELFNKLFFAFLWIFCFSFDGLYGLFRANSSGLSNMIPALSLEDASLVGEHPVKSGINNKMIRYLTIFNIVPVYNRLINKV